MDGTKKPAGRSKTRQFFVRGLAILLPTALTIWIFFVAYQFVDTRIAQPINRGIRLLAVTVSPWPKATPDDIDEAAERMTARQKAAWQLEEDRLRRDLGLSYNAAVQMEMRRQWMMKQPEIVKSARRIALNRYWQTARIGNWVVMDVIGLIVAIILIYMVGVLVSGFIGRRMHKRGEELIAQVPLIRRIYPSVKQVTDFFFGQEGADAMKFNRVVAVEYPRKGIWSVGLVTGDTMRDIESSAGEPCLTVFIPSSPTPFTGYVITVPKKEAVDLPVSIEEALKFAVSLGVLVPPRQMIRPSPAGTIGAPPPRIEASPPAGPEGGDQARPSPQ